MPLDLTGLAAFAGGAQQGYDAEQQRRNALQMEALQLQEARRQQQSEALLLSGLVSGGDQSGQAPQPQSAPVPQVQQPALRSAAGLQTNMPGTGPVTSSIGAASSGPASGAGAVPSGPAPATAMPVMPQPKTPNFEAQLRGMAQRIMRANPGADPGAVGQAVMAWAKLVQQDDSRETRILALQMQLQNRFETTAATLGARLQAVEMQQGGAMARTQAQQSGANQRAQAGIASRQAIADAQLRLRQATQSGQMPSDDDIESLAQARAGGDASVVSGLPWGSPAKTKVLSRAAAIARENGTTLAEADAGYAGTRAAAATVGRVTGSTAQGAQELTQFAPVIRQAAAQIDRTRFPTVNAVLLEAQRQNGDPRVTQLASYIQSAKNAYVQVMTRSGRSTDQARSRSDEIINANMSIAQLGAALDAMAKEAAVAQSSAVGAMEDVTRRRGAPATGDAGAPAPAPSGPILRYDAQGNRIEAQ